MTRTDLFYVTMSLVFVGMAVFAGRRYPKLPRIRVGILFLAIWPLFNQSFLIDLEPGVLRNVIRVAWLVLPALGFFLSVTGLRAAKRIGSLNGPGI